MRQLQIAIIISSIFLTSNVCAQVLNIHLDSCKYKAVSSSVQNRIVSINTKGDTSHYVIGMVLSNCNIDSTYNILHKWRSDDTLDFSVDLQNEYTTCRCYFELKLDVISKHPQDLVITSNEIVFELSPHYQRAVPVKYEIYKGDTINYYDFHGMKQRKHMLFGIDGITLSTVYYQDGIEIWEASYGAKGELKCINFYDQNKIYSDISKNRLTRLIRKREKRIRKNTSNTN